MIPLADIVDTHALVQVLWVSAATGIGVTAMYALAILGATRAVDYSRAGRMGEALLLGILCVVALAAVAASVVFGIVVMTQK